jgi:hypothetical protein
MRVIIRFSIDWDTDGSLTRRLRAMFEQVGFTRIGTSSYEHADIESRILGRLLFNFWQEVGPPATTKTVDHFWMCIDGQQPSLAQPVASVPPISREHPAAPSGG